MFGTMVRHEFKNLLREKMTQMMFVMPVLFGLVVRVLAARGVIAGDSLDLVSVMLALLIGMFFGAAAGMSLLDDRDDLVLYSIQISPVSVWKYIWLKIAVTYMLALIGGMLVVWISGALSMTFLQVLLVSALSAMQVPFTAFLINTFAKNKVEGFVAMKASGFLIIFPLVGYFFLDAKEWLFSIAPGHWAAKAVQYIALKPAIDAGAVSMNLGFFSYIAIGFVYNAAFILFTYRMFKRRNSF